MNKFMRFFLCLFFTACLGQLWAQPGAEQAPKPLNTPRQISSGSTAPVTKAPATDKSKAKADQIAAKLKLTDVQAVSVYNIVTQTEKRIEDLEVGTENYGRLVGYINEERNEMLKAALSPEQYREYQKAYATKDLGEVSKLTSKSNQIAVKKATAAAKEKKMAESLMAKEKEKQEKLAKKAIEDDKKAAQKKKDLEKKELDKQKALAKKEADKQKALAKKETDKQKALDKKAKDQAKKEADKQKALDKKAKDQAKKEADKQKALEKKLEAQRKALEKKK